MVPSLPVLHRSDAFARESRTAPSQVLSRATSRPVPETRVKARTRGRETQRTPLRSRLYHGRPAGRGVRTPAAHDARTPAQVIARRPRRLPLRATPTPRIA